VTAPIDQILLPALIWIDGTALVAGMVWLPLVALAVVVFGSSPLVRDRGSALILFSGPLATVVTLWIVQAYVIPRYLSFLLVPLFIGLASGAAAVLQRRDRGAPVRTLTCLVALAVLVFGFVSVAPDVVGLPREAYRDAAEVIEEEGPPTAAVFAYVRHPRGLAFYLDRPIQPLEASNVSSLVCGSPGPVYYVVQPFTLEDVTLPCLERTGVRHVRFRQYARGNEMNVWYVPPAPKARRASSRTAR
jgi:hypothetical protein